jgi:uracil-DNA glycosylase family 4
MKYYSLEELNNDIIKCEKCPRLVKYRIEVAGKNPKFKNDNYWSKPVPGFGNPVARIVIIGLAPAAHGGNRTGRVFTGDESASNLMKALYEVGLTNQPTSTNKNDGLIVKNLYITAALKCAPPNNLPLKNELKNCSVYLDAELKLLKNAKVYIALGRIAWESLLSSFRRVFNIEINDKKFTHGKCIKIQLHDNTKYIIASYHPSPRNMRTKLLTHEMLVNIFRKAISYSETHEQN